MDRLEQRLKQDAGEIQAEISRELQSRIDASLHNAGQSRSIPAASRPTTTLWLASSLTGLVTAALVITWLNWNGEGAGTRPVEVAREFSTVPQPSIPIYGRVALKTRTADLTTPLGEELLHLQADIEKARKNVERDIRSTF